MRINALNLAGKLVSEKVRFRCTLNVMADRPWVDLAAYEG